MLVATGASNLNALAHDQTGFVGNDVGGSDSVGEVFLRREVDDLLGNPGVDHATVRGHDEPEFVDPRMGSQLAD